MAIRNNNGNTAYIREVTGGFLQKRCPRCGGNVYLDKDKFGWYEECLQCGYNRDLQAIVDARKRESEAILSKPREASAQHRKETKEVIRT